MSEVTDEASDAITAQYQAKKEAPRRNNPDEMHSSPHTDPSPRLLTSSRHTGPTVGGIALDFVEGVGQGGQDHFQVFQSTFGTSGKIHDESFAPNAHDGPRNHGVRSFRKTRRAHRFSHAGNGAIDDRQRCLRSHVAG